MDLSDYITVPEDWEISDVYMADNDGSEIYLTVKLTPVPAERDCE